MANLAIKGHKTRGKEVIEILEMLGGNNIGSLEGHSIKCFYLISSTYLSEIVCFDTVPNSYQVFTLEEFLDKYPYKVGDKVIIEKYYGQIFEILSARWCNERNIIMYQTSNGWYYTNELQPYKKETMEEIKIDIPKGYEFAGVDDDKQQVVFEKVKSKYPKTYRECAEIVGFNIDEEPTIFGYKEELLDRFQKLLICRDAYWKFAGDWKPDWDDNSTKYTITVAENKIYTDVTYIFNYVLCFPTEEMRDAFYKNFEDLIINCMELL